MFRCFLGSACWTDEQNSIVRQREMTTLNVRLIVTSAGEYTVQISGIDSAFSMGMSNEGKCFH
jgi:hypothetical protein